MNHTSSKSIAVVLGLFLFVPGGLLAATIGYQYDALHRLTRVAYPDGSVIAYAYDPAGNRTRKVVSAVEPDSDGDGIPDSIDPDDDNDGVPDARDAFPLDPAESVDTDGDGIGNNADTDDDNDGVLDDVDPDDDNDGIPDIQDPYPADPLMPMGALPGRGGWRGILQ